MDRSRKFDVFTQPVDKYQYRYVNRDDGQGLPDAEDWTQLNDDVPSAIADDIVRMLLTMQLPSN